MTAGVAIGEVNVVRRIDPFDVLVARLPNIPVVADEDTDDILGG